LAIEDTIALRQCFDETPDAGTALRRFEKVRQPVIEDYQAAAYESMRWFENARDFTHLSPIELAYSLMKRSGRVDDEELRKRDPEFVARYEGHSRSHSFRGDTLVKTNDGWKRIDKIQMNELLWTHRNRLRRVIAVHSHPYVGRLVGVKLHKSLSVVWTSVDQLFFSPSPPAERGLGGEVGETANPPPHPTPQTGRGERVFHLQLVICDRQKQPPKEFFGNAFVRAV
jgi:hypothetical protein